METIGFNLRKALQVIGLEGKEAAKILENEEKAYFSTELLFRAFSSFTMMLIMLFKDIENLSEEEVQALHRDRLEKCFPDVFYRPSDEEAAASARKFERLKVAEEIIEISGEQKKWNF